MPEATSQRTSSSARDGPSPGGPRTSAEFQAEVNRIQRQLSAAEAEISDALQGLHEIWQRDFELHREADAEWHELSSPEPGK